MHRIWIALRVNLKTAFNKTTLDKIFKMAMRRAKIVLLFHQYLADENKTEFKKYILTKNLEI